MPGPGDLDVVNDWGVVNSWPAGTPGPFRYTGRILLSSKISPTGEIMSMLRIPDIPMLVNTVYPSRQRKQTEKNILLLLCRTGLFEQCHHLGEIQNTLINFYEEPEYMHELIDYLTEYELSLGEEVCRRLKPDALFHHDDWGSQTSTFISPEMFEEFYLPSYKKIYGLYRSMGVDMIVHQLGFYAAHWSPM